MFSFHSKYFVYRELKRAPQKLSFRFKCPDTGTVRILGNILYLLFFSTIVTLLLIASRRSDRLLLVFNTMVNGSPIFQWDRRNRGGLINVVFKIEARRRLVHG